MFPCIVGHAQRSLENVSQSAQPRKLAQRPLPYTGQSMDLRIKKSVRATGRPSKSWTAAYDKIGLARSAKAGAVTASPANTTELAQECMCVSDRPRRHGWLLPRPKRRYDLQKQLHYLYVVRPVLQAWAISWLHIPYTPQPTQNSNIVQTKRLNR